MFTCLCKPEDSITSSIVYLLFRSLSLLVLFIYLFMFLCGLGWVGVGVGRERHGESSTEHSNGAMVLLKCNILFLAICLNFNRCRGPFSFGELDIWYQIDLHCSSHLNEKVYFSYLQLCHFDVTEQFKFPLCKISFKYFSNCKH